MYLCTHIPYFWFWFLIRLWIFACMHAYRFVFMVQLRTNLPHAKPDFYAVAYRHLEQLEVHGAVGVLVTVMRDCRADTRGICHALDALMHILIWDRCHYPFSDDNCMLWPCFELCIASFDEKFATLVPSYRSRPPLNVRFPPPQPPRSFTCAVEPSGV